MKTTKNLPANKFVPILKLINSEGMMHVFVADLTKYFVYFWEKQAKILVKILLGEVFDY